MIMYTQSRLRRHTWRQVPETSPKRPLQPAQAQPHRPHQPLAARAGRGRQGATGPCSAGLSLEIQL